MRMDSVRSMHATRVRRLRFQMFQSTSVPGLRLRILAASSLAQICGSRSPGRHHAPFKMMVSGGMASIAVTVRVRRKRRLKSRSGRFSIGSPSIAVMRAATANATSGASFTPGCWPDELAERRPLVGRDIQQEHVGHPRRRRAANLFHQRVLHQEHGQREHHARRRAPPPPPAPDSPAGTDSPCRAAPRPEAARPPGAGTSGTRAAWPTRRAKAAPGQWPARARRSRRCAAHRRDCLPSASPPPRRYPTGSPPAPGTPAPSRAAARYSSSPHRGEKSAPDECRESPATEAA